MHPLARHPGGITLTSVEATLFASNEHLRAVVAELRDYSICTLDPAGAILTWHTGAEHMHGYSASEAVGRNYSLLLVPGDVDRGAAQQWLREAAAQGRLELEGQRARKDGTRFHAHEVLTATRTPSGELLGFSKITRDISERRNHEAGFAGLLEAAPDAMVVSDVMAVPRDITNRKRAEDYLLKMVRELRRANEELRQLAYVASHDLQEPLRMVASYTQLLASRYKGRLDSDADEFIGFAVEGATRMQKLIQDLLTYSREGEDSIHVSPGVSSEGALRAALTNLRMLVESSGAVVSHGPLPPITTNELQLVRIFQNLIGNAIKYRADAVPAIHVSSSTDDQSTWHFAIRDNGIGIEARHFEKIFVLFQRLHGPKEYEGTGMGLAICKKAVERLGGTIWVTSTPGTGSTFHFSLPGSNAP